MRTIIECRSKIFLRVLLKATAAYAEKVQPMCQNLKMSFGGNLLLHIFQTVQIRINDLFTFYTNDMRMGIGLIPIVAIAPVGKSQFKNFAAGFDQNNISIDSRKTHCRKFFFYLTVNILNSGMPFAFGKNFDDAQPLWRYFAATVFQLLDYGLKSLFMVRQWKNPSAN